jgi:hypothetical protein
VFGSGLGKAPAVVRDVTARREPTDARQLHVSWSAVKDADFYIIRYGTAPDRLFNNYQVYGTEHFEINSLNEGVRYYVTVDAVNGSGVSHGKKIVDVK